MRNRLVVFFAILLCSVAWGQSPQSDGQRPPNNQQESAPQSSGQQGNGQQSMPGMDMSGKSGQDMSNMDMNTNMKDTPDKENDADPVASAHAMRSMEGHMDMGPHMKMTELRKPQPGDAERAQQIVTEARKASEKYLDYHVALADGFKIFHPEIPQKIYHFTNGCYALESFWNFNPEHPTSLLYEKHGDDYKFVGVMYTAPKRFSEDQLNERIPLSVAQWHEHVNFCAPPSDMPRAEKRAKMLGPNAQFGLKGSIDTPEACDAVGGTFRPVIFNWMVHVYPFEKDQAAIWSVERQHGDAD
jgi:hypothetical protein